ncbi:ABC transporter permease [Celeribacter litoreus]|uniref:ABC transporter permease n=1 Tax=Celeribacter litoreus TaxID=2876714 RepID=UPI001CCC79B5|nr:FtsX-like permease family protein [Celeribacter litoreus]MCA0044420.1 FtsX-like permease family protein [Celeribacter litoreus]
MKFSLAWSIARRELRGGVRGFRVLVLCLVLGVAAIAAVTSVREGISSGLSREGAAMLGGDAELEFTYRFATPEERDWMTSNSDNLSEIADFRSMLTRGEERALSQVKAVDDAYPLVGNVVLDPEMPLATAFAGQGGRPGAVLDPMLFERLGLETGDEIEIGGVPFVAMAALVREPDGMSAGFSLGPRSIVALDAIRDSGLMAAGTLFESAYRLDLPEGTNLDALRGRAESEVANGAFRWRDSRNAAPSVSRFIDRLSAFLVLVGLAGLAVGGVGVSAAVRSYLDRKISVIATLKTLGAERSTVFLIYLMQVGVIAVGAIIAGLILGAVLPLIAIPFVANLLPVPIAAQVHIGALFEAGLYGVLATAIFVLWPLSRAESIRPAALYRDALFGLKGWPRLPYVVALAALLGLLVTVAVLFADNTRLVIVSFLGLTVAFEVLVLSGRGLARVSRTLTHRGLIRKHLPLRLAFGSISGPGDEAVSVVLSLGLGLTVLSAVGQIDANMRSAIQNDLPDRAPSYYVIDIQPDQIEALRERVVNDPGVSRFEAAPMLRGLITQINGRNAEEVVGPHWVLRGDRGITYAETPSSNTTITAGEWWDAEDTDLQISFSSSEATEMGLSLGDEMTVNILGRDITGTITSFRAVDFSGAGMGFVLTMNPIALAGAPHTWIATIYATPEAEAPLIRDLAQAYPNITTIRVRDAIERVVSIMESIAAATTFGAAVTLATGAVVLIGAAAAGEDRRRYEAAILKTLGASRRKILLSFALRSMILGLGAGVVALAAGAGAAWGVLHFVMETDFTLATGSAIMVILGGVALTSFTSLMFSWRAMKVRPARVLRMNDG